MKAFVAAMRNMSHYRLNGKAGKICIMTRKSDQPFATQKTVTVDGLKIQLGGSFKLLKKYDETILRLTFKVKNVSNQTTYFSTSSIKAFDARGVELDYLLGAHFDDSRSIDNDVNILPGAEATQHYYLEYHTPYIVLLLIFESEDDDNTELVPIFLVGEGSPVEHVIKEASQPLKEPKV